MQYGSGAQACCTSMRRILPLSERRLGALANGSPAPPPSPVPMYSSLSGPNASCPALWLAYVGWATWISSEPAVAMWSDDADVAVYLRTTSVPLGAVNAANTCGDTVNHGG